MCNLNSKRKTLPIVIASKELDGDLMDQSGLFYLFFSFPILLDYLSGREGAGDPVEL